MRHKKGPNLYLRLFTTIEAQENYDEARLKRQFEGSSFGKSLAFPKSHLYDQVLRSLQGFHYEKSHSSRFRSELEKIELLIDRGFPDQALRILDKGLERALKYENALVVLQFLRWKRRIVGRIQGSEFVVKLAEVSEMEEKWELALQNEQLAIRLHDQLYAQIQEVRRRAVKQDSDDRREIEKRLESLLDGRLLPFSAKIATHTALAYHKHLAGDFAGVHAAYESAVRTWDAHPHQIENRPKRYVQTFSNWLSSKALTKDYSNLLSEIQRIRKQENLGLTGRARVFQNTYNLELFYYLNAGRYSDAISLIPHIAHGLDEFDAQLSPSPKLSFFYNVALVYWLAKQPGKALKWVIRILHFPKGEVRKDIRDFAPLFEKVLHFELSNIGQLESWFRSMKYRKGTEQEVGTLEKMLLRLIKGLLMTPEPDSHARLYREFIRDIDAFAEEPGVAKLGLQELKQWAEGRK